MTLEFFAHDKISPTAKLVAYWRRSSDIPFCSDVARLFKVEETVNTIFKTKSPEIMDDLLVPLVEIRYKCIQNLIIKLGFEQVLEFASGISLRGLAMTKDTKLTYVETDLPELNDEKSKLVKIIMQKYEISKRSNLFFHAVNILNSEDIEAALKHFDVSKPLAIVHEGLFQYLRHDEKAQAAQNIYQALKRFGGAWITPDLDTKDDSINRNIDKAHFQPIMEAISQTTGRSFLDNAFIDERDIQHFFEGLGFSVDKTPQFTDDIALSSYKNRPINPDVYHMLKSLRLWVLRVR